MLTRFLHIWAFSRQEEEWLRLQRQKELEAHALQEERRRLEHERLLAERLREKLAADLAKASTLLRRTLRHHAWVALWEWARACAGPRTAGWVFREETTELLLARIAALPAGDPALADCLGDAAAHGLLPPMRAAIAKVLPRATPALGGIAARIRGPHCRPAAIRNQGP